MTTINFATKNIVTYIVKTASFRCSYNSVHNSSKSS